MFYVGNAISTFLLDLGYTKLLLLPSQISKSHDIFRT